MRILFTCVFLDGYHGSVMLVKEHAEYLSSVRGGGHDVTVGTILATPEITEFFTKQNIKVRLLSDVDVDIRYDIVFAYHWPTLDTLLERGLKCEKLVMGSLSSVSKLEAYPSYWDKASLLTTMSEMSQEAHHKNYGIPLERMLVFENNIPDAFAECQIKNLPEFPHHIAVISNHIPKEVENLKKFLPQECSLTLIGRRGKIYQPVTPELLNKFDIVISIGKTVQYAMGIGIPVFEYDHFGGNGYITVDIMNQEAKNNFCGRPQYRKLESAALAAELMDGYAAARAQAPMLRELALERFLLSKKMNELLEAIGQAKNFEGGGGSYNLAIAHGSCFLSWGMKYDRIVKDKTKYKFMASVTAVLLAISVCLNVYLLF